MFLCIYGFEISSVYNSLDGIRFTFVINFVIKVLTYLFARLPLKSSFKFWAQASRDLHERFVCFK